MGVSDWLSILSLAIAGVSFWIAWRTYAIQKTMESENILLAQKHSAYSQIATAITRFLLVAHDMEIQLQRHVKKNKSILDSAEIEELEKEFDKAEDNLEAVVLSHAYLLSESFLNDMDNFIHAHEFPYYPQEKDVEPASVAMKKMYDSVEQLYNYMRKDLHVDILEGTFRLRIPKLRSRAST